MHRILIVEDALHVRELYEEVLAERFQVRGCGSIAEAQAAIEGFGPDLVLTDIGLPDGSGLDLVAALRARRDSAQLPVIAISGRIEEHDLLGGFAAGADDYLTKPVANAELLAKCSLWLARKRRQGPSSVEPLAPSDARGADLPGGAAAAFGRYEIRRVLGEGGGGVVYEAEDLHAGGLVALKVLATLASSEEGRQRFLRETYTLSLVQDPHVVRVLDFGASEGRLYFAMQRVEGPTLAEKVRRDGPCSADEARALLAGLAQALCALGREDLVHRDVKPSNVMLRGGRYDQPVLVDFGLCKRPLDRSLTRSDVLVGTPAYMSPEMLLGHRVDGRCDQFALALTLRFALTGREAFADLSGLQLLNALCNQPVDLPAGLPEALCAPLARMTRRDPAQRFASPDELLKAVASVDRAALALVA